MKIVIIDPYTNLPNSKGRPGRYETLSYYLTLLGHEVHIYMSSFSHVTKKINVCNQSIVNSSGVFYHQINCGSYISHISLKRILFEIKFAKSVVNDLKLNYQPDFILFRDPFLFQSKYFLEYIKSKYIKYGIDIIDLWPELFVIALPKFLKHWEKFIFKFFYNRRDKYLANAKLITAVSTNYLSIASSISQNIPKSVFYWGADINKIQNIFLKNKFPIQEMQFSAKCENEMWFIYAGTLGPNYDINTIIHAAIRLQGNVNIKFIVAGSGPLENLFKEDNSKLLPKNISFLGLLNVENLFSLLNYCDVGLITYSGYSTVSMPIKAFDYLAAGLTLLNSLSGEIFTLIENNNLGLNYIPNNIDSFVKSIEVLYKKRDEIKGNRNRLSNFARGFDDKIQYSNMASFIDKNI